MTTNTKLCTVQTIQALDYVAMGVGVGQMMGHGEGPRHGRARSTSSDQTLKADF